ncbi:MAG TPA: carboxypeptidase-like regulatory domain-containing protein, partial [Nitrosopumilaceae archaeon]|nr:carboxypeptidase-like regulatory domain-containing protein [Nitrosopumilaceae archaeon]
MSFKISRIIIFFFFFAGIASSQNFTISGFIKDKGTGESVIGATILIKELTRGTNANVYGFYSLSATKGKYTIVVSAVGYETIIQLLDLGKDTILDFSLKTAVITTEEVVISSERPDQNVKNSQMGTAT